MTYAYFSHNGRLLPVDEAVVPLADIHYAYGYGVYETVRVADGKIRFVEAHCERLMESARIIGLEHPFSPEFVAEAAEALIAKNAAVSCNLKILLRGGVTAEKAALDILCLNPLFPDRKLYKQGAHAITVEMERPYPHAKTLNMLPSYLARREAQKAGAYDALLINRHGCITEGTSTNVFALKKRTLFSPPESDILLGVTRDNVLKVARKNGYEVREEPLKLAEIDRFDSLFLTSTSTKIMPLSSIDKTELSETPEALRELMKLFDEFIR